MDFIGSVMSYGIVVACSLQVLSAQLPRRGQPTTPLSVCDVLDSVTKHDSKMVVVTGVLHQTHRHGTSLEDERGVQGCPGLIGKRKDWPAALYLLWPSNPSVGVSFDRDLASEHEMDRLLKTADLADKDRVILTLEGLLQAKENFQVFRRPDGQVYSTGFGSGGEYPAQLIIRRVIDTKITKSDH